MITKSRRNLTKALCDPFDPTIPSLCSKAFSITADPSNLALRQIENDGHRESGYAAGLAAAAAVADRYGEVQQRYADQCDATMPNSIHAFLLQKLMAQRLGAEIRALLPETAVAGP